MLGGESRSGIASCSFSAGAQLCGALAGKDKEMAAADVVLATDEVGGKTGSRTSKQRKRKRALVVKRARTGGVGRLFDEADKLVGESAGELANLFKEAADAILDKEKQKTISGSDEAEG